MVSNCHQEANFVNDVEAGYRKKRIKTATRWQEDAEYVGRNWKPDMRFARGAENRYLHPILTHQERHLFLKRDSQEKRNGLFRWLQDFWPLSLLGQELL